MSHTINKLFIIRLRTEVLTLNKGNGPFIGVNRGFPFISPFKAVKKI